MKVLFKVTGFVLFSAVVTQSAQASLFASITQVNVNGSGCPAGTSAVSLSPDQSAVAILFDQFNATGGGSESKRRERKDCRVEMTLSPPVGYQVRVKSVDIRGFAAVPAKGKAKLKVRFGVRDGGRFKYSKRVKTKIKTEGFYDLDLHPAAELRTSSCNQPFQMSVDMRLIAKAKRKGNPSEIVVDSFDFSANPDIGSQVEIIPCSK